MAAAPANTLRVVGAARPISEAAKASSRATDGKLDSSLSRIKLAYASATAAGTLGSLDLQQQNPLAHLRYSTPLAAPAVLVDVIVKGNPQLIRPQLEALGFKTSAVYRNDIGGWLPVNRIDDAAALTNLRFFKTAMMHTRTTVTGPLATQGDFAQRSYFLKQSTLYPGLTGKGVTVGVISDSFNCFGAVNAFNGNNDLQSYADDVAQGVLPAGINIVEEDPNCGAGTDEGRAIAQIVYAVAPGAQIAFYTADGSEADFAEGILTLAMPKGVINPDNGLPGAGAQIVDDDVGYFDEPVYQEGEVGDAIDEVGTGKITFSNGSSLSIPPAMYFSSAGNDGHNSYENTAPQFTGTAATGALNAGETLLNMDTSGKTKTYYLPITIPAMGPGQEVPISVYWDQPYQSLYSGDPGDVLGDPGVAEGPGAATVLDICVGDANGNIPLTGSVSSGSNTESVANSPDAADTNCAGPSNVAPAFNSNGQEITPVPGEKDPYNFIFVFNDSNAVVPAVQASLVIGVISGPAPHRVKVIVQDDGLGTQITGFNTGSSTMYGHPLSPNAVATGAAFFYETPACTPSLATAILEAFSSSGGSPFLFDANGNPLANPVVPQKPEIVAPDGVTNTFLGFPAQQAVDGSYSTTVPQCQLDPAFPFNFFGTSAAGPHAAGTAALMLQADPTATPAQIYAAMESSALKMGPTSFDYDNGYGFLQADAAVAALLPAKLTLSASSVQFTKAGSQVLTLSNSGTGPMTVSDIMVTPSGVTETNTCSAPVAAGKSCEVTLTVGASGASASQGVLSFATNAPGGATSVPVSVPAQISVTPQSIVLSGAQSTSNQFPATGGTGSGVVTVTNTGLSALDVGTITVNSSLVSETNNCTAPLAVGASCTVTVVLRTGTAGAGAGTLVIPSNATNVPGGTAEVALAASVTAPSGGGGAFAPGLLLPGLALAGLRRRRRRLGG